jgi:hypothetical protein
MIKPCKTCKRELQVNLLGLCTACYRKDYLLRHPDLKCKKCKKHKYLVAHELCDQCYHREIYLSHRDKVKEYNWAYNDLAIKYGAIRTYKKKTLTKIIKDRRLRVHLTKLIDQYQKMPDSKLLKLMVDEVYKWTR